MLHNPKDFQIFTQSVSDHSCPNHRSAAGGVSGVGAVGRAISSGRGRGGGSELAAVGGYL